MGGRGWAGVGATETSFGRIRVAFEAAGRKLGLGDDGGWWLEWEWRRAEGRGVISVMEWVLA